VAMAFPSRWAFENNLLLEAKARKGEITVGGMNWGMASAPSGVQYRTVAQGGPAAAEHDVAENAFPPDLTRHRYSTGIAVLLGMVVAFIAGVIAVLRYRDIQ